MGYRKIDEVTDDIWDKEINSENKEIIEDFLSQEHLSSQTLKQYKSGVRIFAKWVHDNYGKDKLITDLKPRHARKYQDWLISQGLSPSGIKFKRSAVSSLCGFIEIYWDDEYPNFRNIFTKAIPSVPKAFVKEKLPLTRDEVEKLKRELTKRGDWQKLAYLLFSFSTGCRRAEALQLLTEVIDYEKVRGRDGKEKSYYATHMIRAKGAGKDGKNRRFAFNEETMEAIKKWVEERKTNIPNDDCPYVFVSKRHGKYQKIHESTFNTWCKEFGEILGGRKVYPHLIRSSRATIAVVEENKDIKSVQSLLGHESSTTTEIYVIRDDSNDLDDLFD